jgi:hypothetical protein
MLSDGRVGIVEVESEHCAVHVVTRRLVWQVIDFNQFDLYTKASAVPDMDLVWPYYQAIIDKYMPGNIQW